MNCCRPFPKAIPSSKAFSVLCPSSVPFYNIENASGQYSVSEFEGLKHAAGTSDVLENLVVFHLDSCDFAFANSLSFGSKLRSWNIMKVNAGKALDRLRYHKSLDSLSRRYAIFTSSSMFSSLQGSATLIDLFL